MATAKTYSIDGKAKGQQDLSAAVFGVEVKGGSLHQNIKVYLANQRQGTHKVLGRSEVSGGGTKPFKQKGTGRARAGSNTSPLWEGGGVIFGPEPRDYTLKMPRKMRRQAITGALTAKATAERVMVIEQPVLDKPQTKTIAKMLAGMQVSGKKVLFLASGIDRNLELSCRNIAGLTYKRAALASAYEIMRADYLVMTPAGLKECEEVFGK